MSGPVIANHSDGWARVWCAFSYKTELTWQLQLPP